MHQHIIGTIFSISFKQLTILCLQVFIYLFWLQITISSFPRVSTGTRISNSVSQQNTGLTRIQAQKYEVCDLNNKVKFLFLSKLWLKPNITISSCINLEHFVSVQQSKILFLYLLPTVQFRLQLRNQIRLGSFCGHWPLLMQQRLLYLYLLAVIMDKYMPYIAHSQHWLILPQPSECHP